MKSKTDNNKPDPKYVYDYDSDMNLKYHGSRTAKEQAGWFLPYLQRGMKLVDCGCGVGSITIGLAKEVDPGQVIGVDISEFDIERAQQAAAEAEIPNILFKVGDMCGLEFPDNSVDAAFSHNVLEHIPEPRKAVQEMYRVLKPGGVIGIRQADFGGLILAPDHGFWDKFITIWETDYRRNSGGNPRIGRDLGRLFHEAGFVDVKMTASFDVHSDPEGRNFWEHTVGDRLTERNFLERAIQCGLSKVEELEALKDAWMA